jgi:hypothetical protein
LIDPSLRRQAVSLEPPALIRSMLSATAPVDPAALTNGLTRTEISEAILHTAIYAGVPAANSAFAIVSEACVNIDSEEVGS